MDPPKVMHLVSDCRNIVEQWEMDSKSLEVNLNPAEKNKTTIN